MVKKTVCLYEIIERHHLFNEEQGNIDDAVTEVISLYPDQIQKYKSGEVKIMNFFVGQVLKRVSSADAKKVRKLLEDRLNVQV